MPVMDQCVRLGMAIIIIALISLELYQFSSRSQASTVSHGVDRVSVKN